MLMNEPNVNKTYVNLTNMNERRLRLKYIQYNSIYIKFKKWQKLIYGSEVRLWFYSVSSWGGERRHETGFQSDGYVFFICALCDNSSR